MTEASAPKNVRRLRRPPLARRVLIVFTSVVLLGTIACARSGSADRTMKTAYRCDGGVGFVVSFEPGRAKVETGSGVYVMEARKASFGRRYSSNEAAFAQDEGRAVLVGAVGGPFRNCLEIADAGRTDRR